MPDWNSRDLPTVGYYRVWYGRTQRPAGPFNSVRELAEATDLHDYPEDGMIVWNGDDGVSNVPSLNPDDLLA